MKNNHSEVRNSLLQANSAATSYHFKIKQAILYS